MAAKCNQIAYYAIQNVAAIFDNNIVDRKYFRKA